MARPTLSVLLPNYNHARFLPLALEAMLAQSRPPDEILVIDDASTDDSLEVLERFAGESPRLRLERNQRNRGVVWTLNRLLELAAGDYVYCAAADDAVLPGFFARAMDLLAEHPSAGLASGLTRLMDEDGRDAGLYPTPVISATPRFLRSPEVLEELRVHGSWIQGNTVIYRRDALRELGGFRPELGPFCDGFLHLAVALRDGAAFLPAPVASWRRMAGGYSSATGGDLDKLLAIREQAASLMRTTYREVFPAAYVAAWERAWLRAIADAFADKLYGDQRNLLARLSDPGHGSRLLGRIAAGGLGLLARFQNLAAKAAHFVRWGGFPARRSLRRLASWRRRRRLGLATGPDPRFSIPLGEAAGDGARRES